MGPSQSKDPSGCKGTSGTVGPSGSVDPSGSVGPSGSVRDIRENSEEHRLLLRRVPAGFMRAVSVSGSNMQPSNHHLEKNQTAAALTEPVGNNQ